MLHILLSCLFFEVIIHHLSYLKLIKRDLYHLPGILKNNIKPVLITFILLYAATPTLAEDKKTIHMPENLPDLTFWKGMELPAVKGMDIRVTHHNTAVGGGESSSLDI